MTEEQCSELRRLDDAIWKKFVIGEWVSVKEKLPKLNVLVLIFDGSNTDVGFYTYNEIKNSHDWMPISSGCGCCDAEINATHWMELPEAPK